MSHRPPRDLSIIGIVGLPAAYGGFETLAAQLVRSLARRHSIEVYCSAKRLPATANLPDSCDGASLHYLSWDANGWQSIPYDIASLWRAARQSRTLLILGTSGCLMLPLVRLLWPRTRIVTNVDGLEWKRRKWGMAARYFLRLSEWSAVRFSHAVICDNQGISDHVCRSYSADSHLIAYGGDQGEDTAIEGDVPADTRFAEGAYHLVICRIEPENNIEEILQAFEQSPGQPLVVVGNWDASPYATRLWQRYRSLPNIELKAPIYEPARLKRLRGSARAYIHGHSAGGTNPSLVEAMYWGMPVLAFDVEYNRHTTRNEALYWHDTRSLVDCLHDIDSRTLATVGHRMGAIAAKQYTWATIAGQYEAVLFPSPE